MVDISKLKVGDKVHYQPKHYSAQEWENGMVKEIPEHTNTAVRVVYICGGEWNRFKEYTSALTDIKDLYLGWKHDIPEDNTDLNGHSETIRSWKLQ